MTPEQILALAPRVLTQSQREAYFKDGFIILEKIIGDEWVRKLRDATDELVEVTPKSLRLRKRILNNAARQKAAKSGK